MHRATPLNTLTRSYTAGGSRSVVDKVDDTKYMQEMGGNFMHQETRDQIEAPQNYGFTSVVFDAEKDKDGKITASAETFIGFMGGNRSFPVAGNMDDRRHRLYKLEKGDTAMFRGRGDKQQLHLTQDGGFWTAPQDKTVRMQLLQQDSDSNSTASPAASTRDAGGTDSSGQQQSGEQKRGQEALYKDGQQSQMFVEVTKAKTRISGTTAHMALDDGNTYVHCHTDKFVYLGAEAGKANHDFVVTLSGPSKNVKAKVG
jgi:phage gp45-like